MWDLISKYQVINQSKTSFSYFRFYGHHSIEGKLALDLRQSYFKTKLEHLEELQATIGDEFQIINFRKKLEISGNGKSKDIEDVIECPCGQFKEEGTMIQVSKFFYFVKSCNKITK